MERMKEKRSVRAVGGELNDAGVMGQRNETRRGRGGKEKNKKRWSDAVTTEY